MFPIVACVIHLYSDPNLTVDSSSLKLEDVQSLTESEAQSARDMEPDIRMLDKYKSELKEMDKNISLLQSKLRGVGKIFLFSIGSQEFVLVKT